MQFIGIHRGVKHIRRYPGLHGCLLLAGRLRTTCSVFACVLIGSIAALILVAIGLGAAFLSVGRTVLGTTVFV